MRIPFSSLRYQQRRSADVGHPAVPQLSARPPLSVLLGEAAARQQLLRLPRRTSLDRARAAAGRRPLGRRAVRRARASNAASARRASGRRSASDPIKPHAGVDVKYTPNADNAIDFTIKPDFSQVESDIAQISANERFALFFPEKRPFFLEGVDLFQTPIQAVYTRTITAPDWGGRITGKERGVRYTVARRRRQRRRQRDPAGTQRIGFGVPGLRLDGRSSRASSARSAGRSSACSFDRPRRAGTSATDATTA